MIIDDGYTERHGRFLIRRMIRSERALFMSLLKGDSSERARRMLCTHVTELDGTHTSTSMFSEEIANIVVSNPSEQEDVRNLRTGMALMFSDPLLAIRPCSLCQKWWFDQDTGKVVNIGGQNLLRPKHAPTACRTDAGCKRGTPENLLAFNEKNQKAFEHWQEWRHVGCPAPHDAIVRRNWMILGTLAEKHGLRTVRKTVSGS